MLYPVSACSAATLQRLCGCLLLCMLTLNSVWANPVGADRVLVIGQPGFKQLNLAPGVDYLRDPGGTRDWASVQATPPDQWQPVLTDSPSFGFDTATYWFRFTLSNQSSEPLDGLLEIAYPILDHVTVFAVPGRAPAFPLTLGDTLPYSERPLDHHNFLIPVSLEADQRQQFYLRVQTESAVQVPLIFWQRDAFYQDRQRYLMGQGLYFGMLVVMILYNLFIFFTVRHPSYIYYAFSIAGIGLFMAALHGFGFQYLWPQWPVLNQSAVVASLGVFGCFASAFTISLLQLKKNSPRYYYLLLTHAILYAWILIFSFLLPYKLSILIAIVVGFTACTSSLLSGSYLLYRGLREARYYVLAYSTLMVASIIMSLNKIGIVPRNFFTEHSMQISSMMEVVLLSFALADRINQERRQKYAAQQRALENEKLLRNERERYLEMEFNAKVDELKSQQKIIEAEAESRTKSEFLATMSHEIRTPMNGVLGMAELLQDTPLSPQQQQYLKVINSSGKALLNIINDVLDYSKIAAGKMELEDIDINLENLCLECASVFFVTAERKRLQFLVEIDSNLPAQIQGDPTRLRQILLNLLGNAFKFTQQGRIQLMVSTEDSSGAAQLRFQVADTGIGIPEPIRQNLFSAFVQADSTTTRQFGGTGLGLTISQRLVELMGGLISVTSQPGQGSRFCFTIPLRSQPPRAAPLQAEQYDAVRNSHVILVDESAEFLDLMQRQARPWGLDLHTAQSIEQGLECCRQAAVQVRNPVLLVVSSTLENNHGLACFSRLDQAQLLPECKRVVLTPLRPTPANDALQQAGVHHVIQKPVMWPQLREALFDVLCGRLEAPQTAQRNQPAQRATRRVLVAEDNPINQMVVCRMLVKMGVEYDVADNGRQALDMLLQDYALFDAVLMDCEMPVLDGYEATRLLRQQEAKLQRQRKPVIALTAHVLTEHKARAEQAGMDDFLCKPLEFEELQAKLQALFDTQDAVADRSGGDRRLLG